MKGKGVKCILIIICSLFFLSCKNEKVDNSKPENSLTFKNYETISKISVNYYKNGKISLINNIKNNEVISNNEEGYLLKYVSKTNSYLKYIDNKDDKQLILGFNNEEHIIKDWKELNEVKLSPNGDKILYKRYDEDDNVEFCIYNGEKKEYIPMDIDTLISGDIYYWQDESAIIYYGINKQENKNGIFLYNTYSHEENLIYEVKKGVIEFMNLDNSSVYFILNDLNGNRDLKKLDINNFSSIEITNQFKIINDVVECANTIYILGEESDNGMSLYAYENNKLKKLVYDFPKAIDFSKGIVKDADNNILFIGYENATENEDVYLYDVIEKSIKIISHNSGEYSFIETN